LGAFFARRSACLIPLKLAKAIRSNPTLTARAVKAFCANAKRFNDECVKFPFEDLVMLKVRFSKVVFAKLVQENKFEYAPSKEDEVEFDRFYSAMAAKAPQHLTTAKNLGFRLVCAFEALYGEAEKIEHDEEEDENENENENAFESAPPTSEEYLENLKAVTSLSIFENATTAIDSAIQSEFVKDLKCSDFTLPSADEVDDESWLEVSMDEFDLLMKNQTESKDENIGRGDEKIASMLTGLDTFFGSTSGIDGIDDDDDDDDDNNVNDNNVNDNNVNDNNVNDDNENEKPGLDCDVSLNVNNILEILKSNSSRKSSNNNPEEEASIREIMDQMDLELDKDRDKLARNPIDDSDVEINAKVVENLLESFASQNGGAGPVGNLMQSF